MATSADTHEGWTNRETWALALHLNNSQNLQAAAHRVALGGDLRERAADELREWVESVAAAHAFPAPHDDPAGIPQEWRALLHDVGSLWRVDWYEIAAHFVAGARDAYGLAPAEGVAR